MVETVVEVASDDRVDVPDRPRSIAQLISMAKGGMTYIEERVEHALVSYVRPATGSDPPGFFIQDSRTGPALLVLYPLADALVAGDAVSFDARTLGMRFGVPRITVIDALTSEPTNVDLDLWTQEASVQDLSKDGWSSELVRFEGTVSGEVEYAEVGYLAAPIATLAMPTGLELRMPEPMMRTLELRRGCEVEVARAIVWRDEHHVRPTVYEADDVAVACPPEPTARVAPGTLVVNEIGPGFVELFNRGDESVALVDYQLELVDAHYQTRTQKLSGTIEPHAYRVIEVDDQVGVRLTSIDGVVIDALLYAVTSAISDEVAALGEGVPSPLKASIGRCPDHSDTDDNAWDFAMVAYPSPGETNGCWWSR